MNKKTSNIQKLLLLFFCILIGGCAGNGGFGTLMVNLGYGEPQLFNVGIDKTVYLNVFEDLRGDKSLVASGSIARTEQNIAKFISNALAIELAAAGFNIKKLNLQKNESLLLNNELLIEGKIPAFLVEFTTDGGWNYGVRVFTIELDISISYMEQKLSKKYIEFTKIVIKDNEDVWMNAPDRINEIVRVTLRKIIKRIVVDIIALPQNP